MANLHLYFTGCLLLLTWSCGTVAFPARHDPWSVCAPLFKSLLLNVTGLLKHDALWHGINLEKFRILQSSSDTVLACAPSLNKTTRCREQRKEPFSESECLKNILKDLLHYEAIISSYIKADLRSQHEEVPPLTQTLHIIHKLLQTCYLPSTENTSPTNTNILWVDNSFSNRQKMLMMMRAFHIRTITFNRAVGYIASGEHREISLT